MPVMELRRITQEDFFSVLGAEKRPWEENYLAMYSTQWHAYVTDPSLMLAPMDDHLVHRGDGVFDVMRCVNGKIYQMEAHLRRLERSACALSLELPAEYGRIRDIIRTLVLKGGERDCLVRVVASRGPGGYSANPSECPAGQLYVIVIRYHPPPDVYYQEGVSAVTSKVPTKGAFFATVKSCNYLANVLTKMEAVKAGCQYAIGLDEEGFLAEGSTENICVLSADGTLRFPGFERTLAGVTAKRVFDLAGDLVVEGHIKGVRFDRIPLRDVYVSSEVMVMGTSIKVVPVVRYDGNVVGTGSPGPVFMRLFHLLCKDMKENSALLTPIDPPKEGHEGQGQDQGRHPLHRHEGGLLAPSRSLSRAPHDQETGGVT